MKPWTLYTIAALAFLAALLIREKNRGRSMLYVMMSGLKDLLIGMALLLPAVALLLEWAPRKLVQSWKNERWALRNSHSDQHWGKEEPAELRKVR